MTLKEPFKKSINKNMVNKQLFTTDFILFVIFCKQTKKRFSWAIRFMFQFCSVGVHNFSHITTFPTSLHN